MKRLFAFLFSTLLLLGCEGSEQMGEPRIVLEPGQETELTLSGDAAEFVVSFTSLQPWTSEIMYVDGLDWASLQKMCGYGGDEIAEIKVFVTKNKTGAERTAKLMIKTLSQSVVITFTQNSLDPTIPEPNPDPEPGPDPEPVVFNLSDGSAEVSAEGGRVQVTVQYNVEYDCTISVDWIHEIETKSYDEKVHTFEVDANTLTESRTATISFCGNKTCIPFTITQAAAEPNPDSNPDPEPGPDPEPEYYLNVDRRDISVATAGTSSPVSVNVTSNTSWTVASDSGWCTVSPASGENDGSFNVSVVKNTSPNSRMANVTVSSINGGIVRNIPVLQYPAYVEEGDDAWKSADFYHKSLAFRFTADWCGYCPSMAKSMSNANKELEGRLEVISVHSGGSSLANEASNTLASAYPITGFPTGLIDGRTYIDNYKIATTTSNIVAAVRDTEEKYDVVTGTSWTSTVSGNQVTLDLSAYIKKSGSYKVTALLVEDKVISYQSDYDNGNSESYEHNGIIRATFSNVLGESFSVAKDGQIKTFAYSATLPSSCNMNNVRVVVYIQRLDTTKNSYYVDNAATATVGVKKALGLVSGNWSDGNEGIVPGDDITF